MRRSLVAAAAAALALAGCAETPVRNAFAREYTCNDTIEVSDVGQSRYVVAGCGHTARYTCAVSDGTRTCARER